MIGAPAARARPLSGIDLPLMAVIAALAAAMLALNVFTNGDLGAMLAVLCTLALLAAVWVVPLRWSLTALLFLGATLEAPYEAFACYVFRTPWYAAGLALLGNLNLVTHVHALKFSGFDFMVAYLFVVHVVRRVRGSTIDGPDSVPLPRPLLIGALLSLGSMLFFWFWGLSRGGDFDNSLWQVQKPLYIPILVFLLHTGFRGARDLDALGIALLVAAVYRALLAVYIHVTVLRFLKPIPYATTHADSILFAGALVLLLVLRNEGARIGRHLLTLPAAAVILAGMVYNNRRLAWVALAGSLLIVALVSPWTAWKRRLVRAILVGAPLLTLYAAAGWNSSARLFAPVATVRSMVDSDSDSSTLWRELENISLVKNVQANPWFGTGFGHQYVQYAAVADISGRYVQYRYIPHNSVLALFAFTGAFGVAAIWSLLVITVFLATRAYHRAHLPQDRAAAMMCIVFVFIYIDQVYGDVGVSQWLGPLTVAPSAVLAGKLAISTGAWPRPRRARRTALVTGGVEQLQTGA